jgi:autotransporter-associated beta strand protein
MKQEKVRNASVNGAGAIFSVGNGTTFVVNSMTGTSATNISLNGNGDPATFVPGRLVIDGWHDGSGDLALHASQLRLNATSATNAIGSRVVLSGDIHASGASLVNNNNGNASSPTTNTFTHEHVDFAGEMHAIDVADGTLTFSSAAANHPLQITSLAPGGTTLTKTGPGVWLYQNAVQTSFAGTNRVEEGTLRIGASERLADASNLEVAGGTFDVHSFTETVAEARLIGGAITGSGLVATANGFFAEAGTVDAVVGGNGGLHKSTGAVVQSNNANTYLGDTRVAGGTLQMTHASGLPDATDVLISGGALLDLSFAGVDTIAALVLPGVPQALGLWGATGNVAADFTSDLIAGAGLLNVTSLRGLAGDYNGDNVVDAVDYTVWRNHLGEPDESSIANNGDGSNGVDGGDYALWRMRYGDAQPGAGAGGLLQVVPEPTGAALLALASLLPGTGARWRSQSTSGFHFET